MEQIIKTPQGRPHPLRLGGIEYRISDKVIYNHVLSNIMYQTILIGVVGSVMYALIAYCKEAIAKNEKFNTSKFLITAFIGLIIGVQIYFLGFDPQTAIDYTSIIMFAVGENVVIEKILKAFYAKYIKQTEKTDK